MGAWVPPMAAAKTSDKFVIDVAVLWQGLMGIYTVAILLPSDPLRACHPDEVARIYTLNLQKKRDHTHDDDALGHNNRIALPALPT